jgi:hypothetical protein
MHGRAAILSPGLRPALVFASQSPYSGWKNAANGRNIMRNLVKIFYKLLDNFMKLD